MTTINDTIDMSNAPTTGAAILLDADGDELLRASSVERLLEKAQSHTRHPRRYPFPWSVVPVPAEPTVAELLAKFPSTRWL